MEQYENIIAQVDSIRISHLDLNKTYVISEEPELSNLKDILTRNIEIKTPVQGNYETEISLFKTRKLAGKIFILKNDSQILFKTQTLNFSTGYTYGLGMYLSDIRNLTSSKFQ
ncbi:hypothetical protein [Muricauda sp. MAR_2010_75]|uniref:hypothetical protein n=1 Tax=Allomuricauda sp. MAR_2010_75 TaxID=1250232 RepID=UPI001E2EE20E|nr:hypothetical protein [Muricauda sp. MAR_2010_75]